MLNIATFANPTEQRMILAKSEPAMELLGSLYLGHWTT
jgi:hypothetical protein